MMVSPAFLQKGDTIGICATARWITPEQLAPSLSILERWGFKTKVMPQVYLTDGQLAGSDEDRIQGLRSCLLDPEIKAVLVARGGYGSVRVVDAITDEEILHNPKWICGYSDITVLHNRWNNLGISTIHCTMPISFPNATPLALEQLRAALLGTWGGRSWQSECVGDWNFSAPVVGGNLSVLYSQLGSITQLKADEAVVFMEDVDEMIYHLDRMLIGLKRAGIFQNAKGLLIGGLTQMKDNTEEFGFATHNPWGKSSEQVFKDLASNLNLPIAFHFPAGHWEQNEGFYLNKKLRFFQSENNSGILNMELAVV
jgi:muramoyltetrapeptide carboxypeptidase